MGAFRSGRVLESSSPGAVCGTGFVSADIRRRQPCAGRAGRTDCCPALPVSGRVPARHPLRPIRRAAERAMEPPRGRDPGRTTWRAPTASLRRSAPVSAVPRSPPSGWSMRACCTSCSRSAPDGSRWRSWTATCRSAGPPAWASAIPSGAEGARASVRRTDSGPGRAQPRDGVRPSSAGTATACPPRTCRARRWPPSRRIARPPRCCRTAISRPAARWRRPGRR